jgi:hypothetical protein
VNQFSRDAATKPARLQLPRRVAIRSSFTVPQRLDLLPGVAGLFDVPDELPGRRWFLSSRAANKLQSSISAFERENLHDGLRRKRDEG